MLKRRLTSIFGSFSHRQRLADRSHKPDQISDRLRSRVLLLYRDLVSGGWVSHPFAAAEDRGPEFLGEVHNSLQHLYGRDKLSNSPARNYLQDLNAFLDRCDAAQFFDFLELSFKADGTRFVMRDENEVVDAVNELFRVERAPYQLTRMVKANEEGRDGSGVMPGGTYIRTVAYPQVIRIDETITHAEAIEPALDVLGAPHFEVPNLELRAALEEYRRGRYGDCLTKCGSAFESVLKVLCGGTSSPSLDGESVASLMKRVVADSPLDSFFEQPLLLIATMRNRLSSSHGGGTVQRTPSRYVAQYAITSTAAAIVLLVHASER